MKFNYQARLTVELAKEFIYTVQLPFGLHVDSVKLAPDKDDWIDVRLFTGSVANIYDEDDETVVSITVHQILGSPLREFAHNITGSAMMLACHEILELVSEGGKRLYTPHGEHNGPVLRDMLTSFCKDPYAAREALLP